jgi:very-short-patch-repair endonuclease
MDGRPYRPGLVHVARRLRRDATVPERLLWSRLRRGALGTDFRRQAPVGPYVVDFLCPQLLLVVEVDGRSHDGQDAADRARQAALERLGYAVLRVSNDEVLADLEAVARRLGEAVVERADALGVALAHG